MRFTTIMVGLSVVASLPTGCGGPDSKVERAEPTRETLTTRTDDVVVHCSRTESGDSLQIFDMSGVQRMDIQMFFTRDSTEAKQLVSSWSYNGQDRVTTGQIRVEAAGLPTCETATVYATSLIAAANKGYLSPTNVRRADSWGCDGIPFGGAFSCSNQGACCDAHDSCYAQNGCTASSWTHTLACSAASVGAGVVIDKTTGVAVDAVTGAVITTLACYNACDVCNAVVASCFLFVSPGPSACCDASPNHTGNCNICLIPRVSGNPFGCVADCQCSPGTVCDPQGSGVCIDASGGGGGPPGDPCLGGEGPPPDNNYGPAPDCSPVIIDLSGNGFSLTNAERGVRFDISGSGRPVQLAWTASDADDAFLALDRNGDGTIDNGKELFGNFTTQPPSDHRNGFAALAVFDNGDGIIDSLDAIYPQLRLWVDQNHDGKSQSVELFPLASRGVSALSLNYRLSHRIDRYGNIFRYRARVNPLDPNEVVREDSKVGPIAYDVFLSTVMGADSP